MNDAKVAAGRRGGLATAQKYGHQGMVDRGRLGGRPVTLPIDGYRDFKIARGYEIGRPRDTNRFILIACTLCGEERWVRLLGGKPETTYCRRCASRAKAKGRRIGGKGGYFQIKLYPDDFFYSMARADGYVMEHRLVMARHLKRPLEQWEAVHHKNGNKQDNRIENLELTDRHNHISDHNKGYQDGHTKGYTDGRLHKIQDLERENAILKAEVAVLQKELQNCRQITLQKIQ